MAAVPPSIIEPIGDQCTAPLPDRMDTHPSGCHRPRIPDRVVLQVLVFGRAYQRITDATVSATTPRGRRDERIATGVMGTFLDLVLGAYDRMIRLALDDLPIDCCITKAPCGGEMAGRSSVEMGRQGLKRALAVDAAGIPLGTVAAHANRHDSSIPAPTLGVLGKTDAVMTLHLDRAAIQPAPANASPNRGARPDRRMREARTHRHRQTLGRGAHNRVDQRPQEAGLVHRAPGRRDRFLDRVLGGNHCRGRLVREAWTRDR